MALAIELRGDELAAGPEELDLADSGVGDVGVGAPGGARTGPRDDVISALPHGSTEQLVRTLLGDDVLDVEAADDAEPTAGDRDHVHPVAGRHASLAEDARHRVPDVGAFALVDHLALPVVGPDGHERDHAPWRL